MAGKLILFWEQVGEQAKTYVLDADSEQAAWARSSAGHYINGDELDDDHPIFRLNGWLVTADPEAPARPITGPFEQAVVCGFFL